MDYAAVYGAIHQNDKYFPGYALTRYAAEVADLVRQTQPRSLLDYGSGKGYQYLARRLHDTWGGLLPVCYDVGVRQLAVRPEGTFDGIICSDVLEHIDEDDLPALLADVFGFVSEREAPAESFVFFAISCIPSRHKLLPDGRNVHVTLQPPEWWRALLANFERPGLRIHSVYQVEPL